MLLRWLKTVFIFTISATVISSCKQKTDYSKDPPLTPVYTPSLFIGSQNQYVYALEPGTGKKKWEYNLKANAVSTPLIFNNKYVVYSMPDTIVVLDVNTGELVKKVFVLGLNTESTLLQISDKYVVGSYIFDALSNSGSYFKTDFEKAVNLGHIDSSFTNFFATTPTISSPTIYNNLIIYVDGGNLVAYNMINPASGGWTTSIGGGIPPSSPTIAPPYAYVGGLDGKLYAIDLVTGTVGWTFTANAPILSSPIVYGGNIIFGSSDYTLYCIDSAARAPRWTINTGDRIVSSAYAYNQVVYFASYDYYFYAVNIIDGALKWKYKTGALIKSSPLAHDGTVYVGSFDKNLYAFDTSGILKWSRNIDGLIETSPVLYDLQKPYYPSISGLSEN